MANFGEYRARRALTVAPYRASIRSRMDGFQNAVSDAAHFGWGVHVGEWTVGLAVCDYRARSGDDRKGGVNGNRSELVRRHGG